MEKVFFTKMSGAGNDFIFVDKNQNTDFNPSQKHIRKICDRRNGIGADGLIIVEDVLNYDFKMSYYNADGSTGSLCGNGARCAILFAHNSDRLKDGKARFISNDNEYSGEILGDGSIKFNLNPPKKIKYNFKIKAFGQMITSHFADTGSPHVVIKISDILSNHLKPDSRFKSINDVPVIQIGKEIRYCSDFKPDGTNVNFIEVIENAVHIRTYERGVEDETLACGTGSVAAAIVACVTDNIKPPISLITRGGNKLIVYFEIENQKVKNLSLTGPAEVIFEGSTDKKFFI
jgi:diaminopimelate epimerase